MSKLPARPSLASLRKQAKSLLNGFLEKHPETLTTIPEHHPKADRFSTLRDAQLVVARQYGHPGWAELGYFPSRYTPEEAAATLQQLIDVGVDPRKSLSYALDNVNPSNAELKLEIAKALIAQGVPFEMR